MPRSRQVRHRRLIARYEARLAEGLSSCSAVTVLVREFRLSNRQIEKIVNGPSPVGVAMEMVVQGFFITLALVASQKHCFSRFCHQTFVYRAKVWRYHAATK